jgi:hypothetical protein
VPSSRLASPLAIWLTGSRVSLVHDSATDVGVGRVGGQGATTMANGNEHGDKSAVPAERPLSHDLFDVYEDLVEPGRIGYPHARDAGVADIIEMIRARRSAGAFVGICDGAFDVPTDSHVWWLRDCRHHAATDCYGDRYARAPRDEKVELVASDRIYLIATVDADAKVASQKAFKASKGNIDRPVYEWNSRARRVAGYMIPDGRGRFRPIVDLVIVEGDPAHAGTPLQSHLSFGAALASAGLLDCWLLCDDHEFASTAAQLFDGTVVIKKRSYATDPRTGETWSSTYIIQRIRAARS